MLPYVDYLEWNVHSILRKLFPCLNKYLLCTGNMYINIGDKKSALELGCLTEDILIWPQLIYVLTQAKSPDMMHVTPLQWYYNQVLKYPVWGGNVFIFRVNLALINAIKYNRYQLSTWPVPYASKPGYA